ncbi:hypothetical protein SteCoe_29385 [Stentor coeruleus]|uniref:Uncharacterized protein n=1 Tax=Stentor coeruleus TaxID=5963 RepID=A0A1R2B6F2_9CILI|nr:hypothetical protein SteCoe_29385 [Stentor coeruleus]
MSITKDHQKLNKLNKGTPVNPFPQINSKKKKPPLLIKLHQTRKSFPDYPEAYMVNAKTDTFNNKIHTRESLPPISQIDHIRKRKFKYLSPKFKMNLKNIRPLFEQDRRTSQLVNISIESLNNNEQETETEVDLVYRIKVITKKFQRS